ncbi:hypothetical protein [Absidia glauca]|uniref:Rgp1-domain-containing protein n=1 Tax=Absidia glauca TaxID=4829 RepID=A0A168PJP6_ABSGL|nr:hypothetical protein [Absidia glauca]
MPKPISASSSITRQDRHKSPPPEGPYNNCKATNGHSRSPSTSSAHDMSPELPPSESITEQVSNGGSRSLTWLATSTLAYLAGYSSDAHPPDSKAPNTTTTQLHNDSRMHTEKVRETTWEKQDSRSHSTDPPQPDDINDLIAVELDSHDNITPRTSIDTLASTYIHPALSSRRSSTDSLASSHPYYSSSQSTTTQQQQNHSSGPSAPPRRLSRLLKSPSTPSLMKKTEHLLWGSAQVVGQFVVDPTLINNNEFAPLKQRTMYRPQGAGFGGGGGLWNGKHDSKIDTRTTPVFSTPPSILFVDLDLAPGETKKYTYKLRLPNDLPPSHRGKSIRFNYYLVVGTQRAGRANGMQQQGQVFQLRFRVLNHVSEDGSVPIYDLMNPVVMYKDEAQVELVQDHTKSKRSASISSITSLSLSPPPTNLQHTNNAHDANGHPSAHSASPERAKERRAFMDYVNQLVEKSTNGHDDIHEITRRESDAYDEQRISFDGEDDVMTEQDYRKTCAQVVSRLTHASRKAMYDLCKNNQRVAKLQLTKMAHRLGEPILGVLDFGKASISTYKASIHLFGKPGTRGVKYILTSTTAHRAGLAKVSLRIPYFLPESSTPGLFSSHPCNGFTRLPNHRRFEFITNNLSKTADVVVSSPYLPVNIDQRQRHFQAHQQVQVSTFDCNIPVKIYGSPSGSDRGHPHTFSVQ